MAVSPATPQEHAGHFQSQQPAWASALGCLAGISALAFLFLFAAASCTDAPKADGQVVVEDSAELLSPALEAKLGKIRFPEDTPVIVRTVGFIPARRVGSYATERMRDESGWQIQRPRGFLRHYIRQDSPSSTGVYVLVSREPQLVQIRFGRDIRIAAYQAGLAAGTWYREQQEFGRDEEVVETIRDLAERMREVVDPWWLLSWAQTLSSMVSSEVEDWLSPSDGIYSNRVLGGYLRLADVAGGTGSPWRFVAFNALAFIALWLVVKKLLVQAFLLPRVRATWLRAILKLVTNLGLMGVLLTGFSALALLSRGRIEDELALEALGLSFISTAGFSAALFSTQGGWWLAIPAVLVSFFAEVAQSAAESDAARQHGQEVATLPLGWVAWGCALYLLPMAIGIPAFLVLTWNSVTTFAVAARSWD